MLDALGFDLTSVVEEQPGPLLFAPVSGAHLYGFPSRDSDIDLRGAHLLPAADPCLQEVLARERSVLPEHATAFEALDEFVVRHRAPAVLPAETARSQHRPAG